MCPVCDVINHQNEFSVNINRQNGSNSIQRYLAHTDEVSAYDIDRRSQYELKRQQVTSNNLPQAFSSDMTNNSVGLALNKISIQPDGYILLAELVFETWRFMFTWSKRNNYGESKSSVRL
jgi:hypothetical protein